MLKDLGWIWRTKQKCFDAFFTTKNQNALTWPETNALNDNRFVCGSLRTLPSVHRMIFEVHFSIHLDLATFFLKKEKKEHYE